MNFALVQFMPGDRPDAHYHNVMEENFYIIEGEVDIVVDGKRLTTKGRRLHSH